LLVLQFVESFLTNSPHNRPGATEALTFSWSELTAATWRLEPTTNPLIDQDRIREVTFASPLLEYGYPPAVVEYENRTLSEKPLLLYLPGFDGTDICPFLQFPELSTVFDIRCLTMSMQDRSTFDELKEDVMEFIYQQVQLDPTVTTSTLRKLQRTPKQHSASKREINTTKGVLPPSPVEDNKGTSPGTTPFISLLKFMGGRESDVEESVNRTLYTNRAVYLVGESFGSLLACEVALSLLKGEKKLNNLKGLVLINAATCYDRSKLAVEAPAIAKLPSLFYPLGVLKLLPLFGDEYSASQLSLILQSKYLPSVIDSAEREAYMGRVAFSLPWKLKFMPRATLRWRLSQWLEVGCARMEARLGEFREFSNFRILIVAGERDWALPSIAEAERLASLFPNSQVHIVEGAGHASTCGSRVDLCAILRSRFSELRSAGISGSSSTTVDNSITNTTKPSFFPLPWRSNYGRTAMKETASKNKGVLFGMEPRYNGKEVGLPVWRYWSRDLYRRVRRVDVDNINTKVT
jgi:pimeloyl-ACP methyl ester carboxylesterase